jgi:hypothetical protein
LDKKKTPNPNAECAIMSNWMKWPRHSSSVFLIGIVGEGVQLGTLGTAATSRPIVPAPGDYDDGEISGMMIGRGNRSTQRKPAPMPLCPLCGNRPHFRRRPITA